MALFCVSALTTYNSYVCDSSAGGTETFYAALVPSLSSVTISAGNVITAMVMSGVSKFQELRPYMERGEASAIGSTNEFGNTTYNHNIKFEYVGVSTESVQHSKGLFKSNVYIIHKAASGKYWMYGLNGATNVGTQKGMTGKGNLEIVHGVKSDDFSGVRIEMENKSGYPIIEIDSSILTNYLQSA